MGKKETLMNERIRAREVRLIGADGAQLGIQKTEEALRLADEAGMDLVLVAEEANPPVARIMDYGKFKYEQKKRQHGQHHHQPQIKELRLRPKTEEHDLQVRVKQARGFVARGDRVIVNVRFRGREMAHAELGREILDRFAKLVEDVAKIEKTPTMEGRRMIMVLAPK